MQIFKIDKIGRVLVKALKNDGAVFVLANKEKIYLEIKRCAKHLLFFF